MPTFILTPTGRSARAFHDLGVQRGDGLHPALLEALSKSGSVSGPPAKEDPNPDNVVRGSFSCKSGTSISAREGTK